MRRVLASTLAYSDVSLPFPGSPPKIRARYMFSKLKYPNRNRSFWTETRFRPMWPVTGPSTVWKHTGWSFYRCFFFFFFSFSFFILVNFDVSLPFPGSPPKIHVYVTKLKDFLNRAAWTDFCLDPVAKDVPIVLFCILLGICYNSGIVWCQFTPHGISTEDLLKIESLERKKRVLDPVTRPSTKAFGKRFYR